jgi:hypothetical protein
LDLTWKEKTLPAVRTNLGIPRVVIDGELPPRAPVTRPNTVVLPTTPQIFQPSPPAPVAQPIVSAVSHAPVFAPRPTPRPQMPATMQNGAATSTPPSVITATPAPAQPIVSSTPSTPGAAATGGGTVAATSSTAGILPTAPVSADWIGQAETWLQSSSLIGSIPNYWIVGGALLVGVLLAGGKKRR